MATARKEIRKAMPDVDLVIEILDARIPFSSENPLVAELRGNKPCIQVLNKADLADPAATEEWLEIIRARPSMRAVTHHVNQPHFLDTLLGLMRGLVAPVRSRPTNAMILGIPNVGKSTLINAIANRKVAKAANRPAITQNQQRVNVNKELVLFDTPGFLWPKLTPEACGYRLAVTGAISDRVVEYQDIAGFAAKFLAKRYPKPFSDLYGLAELPATETEMLEAVGRKRGFLLKGGVVDMQRASERLIHDLRNGLFGPITLETPRDCGVTKPG